jgi:hypothetical protein
MSEEYIFSNFRTACYLLQADLLLVLLLKSEYGGETAPELQPTFNCLQSAIYQNRELFTTTL